MAKRALLIRDRRRRVEQIADAQPIGETAICYAFPVLTTNALDFRRMPGCDVEVLE